MNLFPRKPNAFRLTRFASGLGIAALLGFAPAFARAQGATVLALYRGDDVKSAGIQLGSWGSGSITEDTKVQYGGSESLRLVTHGLYQGATLGFTKPVDLSPYMADKNAYLQFALLPPGDQSSGGTGRPSGPPGFPGSGYPGSPRSGFPGAPGAGSYGSYGGNKYGGSSDGGSGTVKVQKARTLSNVRVLLVSTTGKSYEMLIPMSYAVDDNQWKLLSYPISVVPGLKPEDAQIKELRLFGDAPGTVYVGKIGVVTDTNRIMIEPQEEKIVNPNVNYRYTVSAKGGITPLNISWDWDDRDGIQDESQGRSVTHTFRKSGDFKVTVTASDPFGVKAPATMKFNVHVP